jgi:sugar lactone lactonase YvrE
MKITPPSSLTLTATLAATTLLALSTQGCGNSKGTPGGAAGAGGGAGGGSGAGGTAACVSGGSGELVLAIEGLPAGTVPPVRVAGGGLTAPMDLKVGMPVTLDARGGYGVETARVKVAPAPGSIVGKAYFASGSSFDGCIKSGVTATATLTYTAEPGSEHLWIGVSDAPTLGNELAGFAGVDIAATAAKNPAVWKTKNFVGRPGAGAFDSYGNFWVPGGDFINKYDMTTLATPGDAPPAVVITLPDSSHANFVAFDAAGNLWVTEGAPVNKVVRFSPADLGASGSPAPGVVLTSPDLMAPAGLAFDAHGNLWVACAGNDEVLRFNPEHLGASSAGPADAILTAETAPTAPVQATYTAPNGLAFDQAGDLWVGYVSNLVGFTPAQQATTALVAGPIALNVSVGTGGFAFDESGGLWCAGDMGIFRRFPKAALAATGDATPDIVITSSELGYAEMLVLDPAPTWSPLRDW